MVIIGPIPLGPWFAWNTLSARRYRCGMPTTCALCGEEQYTEYVNPPEYILPHSDFGAPECCGLLLPFERGDFVDIICNECGASVQSVEAEDLVERSTKCSSSWTRRRRGARFAAQ